MPDIILRDIITHLSKRHSAGCGRVKESRPGLSTASGATSETILQNVQSVSPLNEKAEHACEASKLRRANSGR